MEISVLFIIIAVVLPHVIAQNLTNAEQSISSSSSEPVKKVFVLMMNMNNSIC